VFTEEDRVVIKFQRQNRGYSARRLVKEFTLKNWNTGSLNKLLKKIDDTGSTAQLFPAAVGEELLNCMMRTSNGLEIQFQFLYCAKFLTHAKIKCMEL